MDKMNKTDKINKNKVEKILEEMVKNKENNEENTEIEEFLSKETMDDVYKFFLKKDPSITIDEFDDCVAQMLELNINTPEMEPLDNDKIDKIVGGANIVKQFGSKMTSMLLAALTLLPGISSMASASAVDTHTAAGEGHKSSIAEKCCQMKDTVKSLSESGFNKVSNFVKKHPWVTTGICAAMLAATGTAIAMKNRNNGANKSNQENKSEVKQSGNTSVTQSTDSKKTEVNAGKNTSVANTRFLPGVLQGAPVTPSTDPKKPEVKANNGNSASQDTDSKQADGDMSQVSNTPAPPPPPPLPKAETKSSTDSKKPEVQAKDNNDNEVRARAVAELDKKLEKKKEEYGKNNTPSRDPLIATIANDLKIKRLQELNKYDEDEEDDEHSNNPEELNNDNSASQDTDSKQADGDMSQVSNNPAPLPPPPLPNTQPKQSTNSKKPEVKAKTNNNNSAPSGAPASGQNQDLLAQIRAGITLKPTSVKKKQEEYEKNKTPSGAPLIATIAENSTIDTMLGKVKPVEVNNNQTPDGDWETDSKPEGEIDKKTLSNNVIVKDRPESWANERKYGTDAPAEAKNPAKPESGPSNTTPRPLPTLQSQGKLAKPPAAAAQTLSAAKPTVKPNSNQSGTNKRTLPTPKPQGTAAQTPKTAAQTPKTAAQTPVQPKSDKLRPLPTPNGTAEAKKKAKEEANTPVKSDTASIEVSNSLESQSKTKEERINELQNKIKQLEKEREPYKRRVGHFFRSNSETDKDNQLKQQIGELNAQINELKKK